MADKITWANKESLVTDPTILEKNKVTDSNMNEIKSVVNDNADNLDELIVEGEENITENTRAVIKEGVIRHFTEISNTYGTSESIGYSQKYENAHNVIVSADTPTTSERVWFKKSRNLFDKNSMVLNAFINGGNGQLASSNDFRTIYFKCKFNTTYTFYKNVTSNRYVVGYSSDTDLILPKTLTNIESTNTTFTTANDTQYVFIMISKVTDDTSNINDILNSIMINEGSSALPYEPYVTPSINVDGEEIYNQNVMNYSTTEQVVGKWIDGKPLYRKVFNITNPTSSNTNYIDISSMNIDTATHLYGYYKTNAGTFGIPFHDSNDNLSVMFISGDTNLYIRGRFGNNYTSITEVKVVLEYTKTTD